jgi:hypothetical protein
MEAAMQADKPYVDDERIADSRPPEEQPSAGEQMNDRRPVDKRGEWLRQLDEECPYQVVLPRGPSGADGEIMKFLTAYVGRFDMYVEDEYAVFVRYCFADPLDAAIFRSRFEYRATRFKLAG